jgi:hypothetical protein
MQEESTQRDIQYLELLTSQRKLLGASREDDPLAELQALTHRVLVGFDLAMAPINYRLNNTSSTITYEKCLSEAKVLLVILQITATMNLAQYLPIMLCRYALTLTTIWLHLYQQAYEGCIRYSAANGHSTSSTSSLRTLCDSAREKEISNYLFQIIPFPIPTEGNEEFLQQRKNLEAQEIPTIFNAMRQSKHDK